MAEGDVVSNEEGAAQTAPSAPTGSGLDLIGLTKVFAGGTVAVDDVNLHVDHGEYVVLLGPSGCGKTTTLRMIGGHEFPSEGDIVLDGQSLVDLPPHKRPTTTVFQHFALFPHRSRARQRRVRAEDGGHGQGGAARQGDGGARHGRAHRAPGPEARGPVRGPAAARRARACARDQAQGATPRRAARGPRPPAAAAHARRAPEPPAPTRADVHPRHAQPGRGPVDGRPNRGHERRPHPAGRRPADDRHEAGHGARRPLHGRQQHHQRHGDAEPERSRRHRRPGTHSGQRPPCRRHGAGRRRAGARRDPGRGRRGRRDR